MQAPYALWPDLGLDLFNNGADLAMRNAERWWTAQIDGCREWLECISETDCQPTRKVERQMDHAVHFGCELLVAQVAALNDSLHLVERAVAESQKTLLQRLDLPGAVKPALAPVRSAVCVSGCAYDSMSKATRQVASFASSRFSAAAVNALHQARDKITETNS
ncbi:hypothetical protein [Chitinimonas lacunae]|uniref:Phasin family protein n=1 Tax=Chitinimonas lacunae TaxID=1963018 RepID=A0ABV8MPR3_9NEIS